MPKIMSKVVGVSSGNKFERQRGVRKLSRGQELELRREPNNEFDKNAIAVIARVHQFLWFYPYQQQIGYLSADLAEQLAELIDAGQPVRCFVANVTGGGDKSYGCNIRIEF